jgi:hypothetical protein
MSPPTDAASDQKPAALHGDMTEPAGVLLNAAVALDQLLKADQPDERVRRLHEVAQTSFYLPDDTLRELSTQYLQDDDGRIRGEMCYALGRSARPQFAPLLELLLDDPSKWVREQAKDALRSLECVTPVVPNAVTQVLLGLSEGQLDTIRGIAASKSSLLANYYTHLRGRATEELRSGLFSAIAFGVAIVVLVSVSTVGELHAPWRPWAALVSIAAGVVALGTTIVYAARYHRSRDRVAQVYRESDVVAEALSQLATAKSGEVQRIAAAQWRILDNYYNTALSQAKASYRWASAIAVVGAFFFLAAATLTILDTARELATIGAIGGTLVEVVSGIGFYLYGRTAAQLADFHRRLHQTHLFMLANSVCDSLDDPQRQASRAGVIQSIGAYASGEAGPRSDDR